MDKWFPVGLFRCVQYCCYLLFYIIRQVCDTPWIHCKAVLLVNLSMLCRLDDLSDWKHKCKFLCSYSLAMAGWRRGPTKEKERITSPLLHQPKSMLWFRNIKGIALPFLYINLISMHQSIWSFNIPLLDNLGHLNFQRLVCSNSYTLPQEKIVFKAPLKYHIWLSNSFLWMAR